MSRLADIQVQLEDARRSGGYEAVVQWIESHASELSEEDREKLLFQYSGDALLEDYEQKKPVDDFVEKAETEMKRLEQELQKGKDDASRAEILNRLRNTGA